MLTINKAVTSLLASVSAITGFTVMFTACEEVCCNLDDRYLVLFAMSFPILEFNSVWTSTVFDNVLLKSIRVWLSGLRLYLQSDRDKTLQPFKFPNCLIAGSDRWLKNSVLAGSRVILLMHRRRHPACLQPFYGLFIHKRAWPVTCMRVGSRVISSTDDCDDGRQRHPHRYTTEFDSIVKAVNLWQKYEMW